MAGLAEQLQGSLSGTHRAQLAPIDGPSRTGYPPNCCVHACSTSATDFYRPALCVRDLHRLVSDIPNRCTEFHGFEAAE